jgi:uncharacterized protein YbjT (DUF2867 family)
MVNSLRFVPHQETVMDKTHKIILVTGATGRQGGAAARHLLANGWRVRAPVRNLDTPAAEALHQDGAEVVQGDNENPATLETAMQGVYGVFSVQPAVFGYETEVLQGKNIADAAKAAGVQHFVYTSVGGAEGQSRVRKLGKWEIEQYIQALGLPTTILRPANFMEDIIGPRFGVPYGTFSIALKPDVPLRLIAVDDIGAFAALVFEHPDEYLGKIIELAGDSLTPPQVAASISHATERSISYIHIPIETIRQQNPDVALVFYFLNEIGYQTDIPALRKLHPDLKSFETWLQKEGKAQLYRNNK